MVIKRFPLGKLIFFATGNFYKFNEARKVLSNYNIATAMLKIKKVEIQDNCLENIARESALNAANNCHLPIIVEDAGLFIETLKNFPGPYSKYVFETIGLKGILKLLTNHKNRKAKFRSVIAFCSPELELKYFHGIVEGKITERITGELGFGFDPIFKPLDKPHETFGEMNEEEKNQLSHRAKSLKKFAQWYISSWE
jgi:XTP/dITP diphosphohydrolase